MQSVVNSIDKAKAISLATSSTDFQTKVHGFKYVFSDIFTNMTENQKQCGEVKLTSIAVEFSLLNSTSNFVKFVQVGEDPTISQVTFVEDVFVQNCNNNCPLPSPPAGNVVQEILSPLRQIASGTAPRDVKCNIGFVLVIKAEDNSPACVRPEHVALLVNRGWALPVENPPIHITHEDLIVVEDTGTTIIGNQTYYFTTLNDTLTSYHGIAAIPMTFRGLNFTLLPSVFSAGPPGSCGDTGFGSELKFSDETYEYLGVHIPGSPCIENYTETALTNHQNPQAGLEDYYGKIRLLVSTNVNSTSTNTTLGQGTNSNQIVSVVSIKGIPPYTPGGPTIQLTVKNIDIHPITSLKAVLELNNNYTFDFKGVTSSTPLVPDNSKSDTQILIGAGYQTEIPHPLTITGIENNAPFRYTENVYIQ